MVTSQAAVGSGRPRRSPATVIMTATSTHKSAHTEMIEAKVMVISFVSTQRTRGAGGTSSSWSRAGPHLGGPAFGWVLCA